jgi:outer membrane receptor protein involved in Fe transport
MRHLPLFTGLLLAGTAALPAAAHAAGEGAESADRSATSEATAQNEPTTPAPAPAPAPAGKAFTTGVAKGRDLLDTAISASVLSEKDLAAISTVSVAGALQNIPGIRSETSDIDGFSSITIRGLPLASEGSKFLQLQEDGLPVLEFGDIRFAGIDQFMRVDLSLAQVQAIRGGSASTFASNSPGGLINFISHTGETAGGMVQVTSGLGFDLKRVDFAYGTPLGGGWRFHVGGFYRTGEGPREIGYTGFSGGQIKANITREFENGYIRVYAKYLNDRQPNHGTVPVSLTGTDADPVIGFLGGYDITRQGFQSPLTATIPEVDRNNNRTLIDSTQGLAARVASIGLEAQFEIAGWTVTNRFRFADISGAYNDNVPFVSAPAPGIAALGGPGARLRYAAGPLAGQTITDARPVSLAARIHSDIESLDNLTNDLRASRTWDLGASKLTTTAGLYNARQDIGMFWNFATTLQDLAGGGRNAPLDLVAGNGMRLSDGGVLAYGFALGLPFDGYHTLYDLGYDIVAPYGSVNWQVGKLSLGASLRWDKGNVTGQVFSPGYGGGRVSTVPFDVNGDGQLTPPEARVVVLPLSRPATVDYDYDYVSWSAGVNYRFAEPFSAFARYSHGGRASNQNAVGAESLNQATGAPVDPALAVSLVDQAEAGVKFRKGGLALYLTGFWASTDERNFQISSNAAGQASVVRVERTYSAKGLEFEGEFTRGAFSLNVGGTLTDATIDSDAVDPRFAGKTPRHIPDFAFFVRGEVDLGRASIGTVINASGESYAQDTNQLVQPGYVIVSPYVQLRPAAGVTLAINAFNVFDTLAVVSTGAATIPSTGIANVQAMNGRTVTARLRYAF